ncbi:cyclin-dependent kinase inhibitor 4 [Solanum dulcamara]|uniref:cyclin-dependent kinase inhibitor 4 n=1 Tax=Solanum dulcamara TaxID=45834 RepID=UPI0024850E53|nr:cyclin-dependent kinase inhibitor 4 [Solanum dulcamara]
MGKYIRKSKKASPLGVLTRAKALALNGGDGGSYLELRSRRLVKPFTVIEGRRQKNGVSKNPNLLNPNPNVCVNSEVGKECLGAKEMEEMENLKEIEKSCCGPADSFGENLLEFEGRKRTTRESTPCSLIRDSDSIPTPGSSTRRTNPNEANSRVPNSVQATIPTDREMDEFFARAEAEQQRKFIEKYNFDPVNDKPLPGRYKWVKVDH